MEAGVANQLAPNILVLMEKCRAEAEAFKIACKLQWQENIATTISRLYADNPWEGIDPLSMLPKEVRN